MDFLTELKIAAVFWIWLIGIILVAATLVGYSVGKDIIKNLAAYVVLKAKTSYQFQNSFIMDGKSCQIKFLRPMEVVVIDVDTLDERYMSPPEFKKEVIWRHPPERRVWTEEERKAYREILKQKSKIKWNKADGS